jgi:PKD repeat protein
MIASLRYPTTRLCLLALAVAAAALPAPATAAVKAPRARLLGVVPHRGEVSRLAPSSRAAAAAPTNLTYHGGPVMHTNTTYAIYWRPPSYATDFSATYRPLVNQFLSDVAADSAQRTNVYASDTQYNDATGHARYLSTYGGSFGDSTAYPSTTCQAVPGKPCLTDDQIAARVNGFVGANGLPRGLTALYFVLTPPGVAVCDGTGTDATCSNASGGFCAYHSELGIGAARTLYAVEPYPAISGCSPGQSPNNDAAADAQINLISHEHNEAITDPTISPGAWYDGTTGQENGDKCAWGFGTPLGQTGAGQQYNQLINGRSYWLQREWSNFDTACVQQFADLKPTATFTSTPNPASAGQAVSFNVAGVSDPDSDVTGYTWDFGDGGAGAGQAPAHGYSSPGTYAVTLTVHDNDGLTPLAPQAVSVMPSPSAPPPSGGASPAFASPSPSVSATTPTAQNALALPTIGFFADQGTVSTSRSGSFSYSLRGTPAGANGRISFATASAIAAARKRKLNLGSASFNLSSTGRTKVALRLSRSNLATLKRRRGLSVKATVTIGSVTRTATFRLKAPR